MADRKKKLTRRELDRQIRAVQSLCRQKPGEKSLVQELIEERRAEKTKEDREPREIRGRKFNYAKGVTKIISELGQTRSALYGISNIL